MMFSNFTDGREDAVRVYTTGSKASFALGIGYEGLFDCVLPAHCKSCAPPPPPPAISPAAKISLLFSRIRKPQVLSAHPRPHSSLRKNY